VKSKSYLTCAAADATAHATLVGAAPFLNSNSKASAHRGAVLPSFPDMALGGSRGWMLMRE
jgi:hypothetical protein|tara:strand:+ start:3745 stop:3927 length:183 start_codon:yes stop_codon:yes gene_type:complete